MLGRMAELWVCNLGLVPYAEALALQLALRDARQADAIPDTLLLLEHPPVYTRGRRSGDDELPAGAALARRRSRSRSSRSTAAAASPTTARASSSATRSCGSATSSATCGRSSGRSSPRCATRASRRRAAASARPACGPPARKIASIGVHVSRRVTTHGFAVNADNDLEPFEWIVPCGLPDVRMTSIARETGRARHARRACARDVAARARRARPARAPARSSPERLAAALGAPVG